MTQDEIIEMARQAGGSDVGGHGWTTWVGTQSTEFLERLIKLATAKEREACAELIEKETGLNPNWQKYLSAAIRARGQA
jgi:hypothetical protein